MAKLLNITCFCAECGEGDIKPTKVTVSRKMTINLFFTCPCCEHELVGIYAFRGVYFADVVEDADGR